MELSIIFVNWNSLAFLRDCLVSVYEHLKDVAFEVIVVDNASPEGSVDSLRQEFPDIVIIESRTNLGFAGANNIGFRHSKGNYLLFLNPDTKLTGPAIQIMLGQSKSLPDAGIVGCKLLNTDLSIQTSCIQTFPTVLNQLLDVEYLQLRWPSVSLWNIAPLFSNDSKPRKVEVISGACMLVRREVFERAGMFSEDYFMYAEDIDLCSKVERLGFQNYYVGQAELIHHGGKSSGQAKVNQWSTIMKLNAVQKFCTKTHGHFYGLMYRLVMGCAALGRLLILFLARVLRMPDSKKVAIQRAESKWTAVLKWSFGLTSGQMRSSPAN